MRDITGKVCCLTTGVIFLVSGFTKAVDAESFANLLSSYGAEVLGLLAPLIILFEIVAGLFLLFQIRVKITSIICIGFIVAVTGVFLFGYKFLNITDCGCFGNVKFLQSNVWFVFARNILILGLLVLNVLYCTANQTISKQVVVTITVIVWIVSFMCGFSIRGASFLQHEENTFSPIKIKDSHLFNLINTDADTTYLLFIFSYKCPYCLNSIGNIEQYEAMNYVDKVIGLAVYDSIGKSAFLKTFSPKFKIVDITADDMRRITRSVPTAFVVRNDSIIDQYDGLVSSPVLLPPIKSIAN